MNESNKPTGEKKTQVLTVRLTQQHERALAVQALFLGVKVPDVIAAYAQGLQKQHNQAFQIHSSN